MATTELGSERTLSIGGVIGTAFGVIGSNPLGTLGVAFVLSALPTQIYSYLMQVRIRAQLGEPGAISPAFGVGFWLQFVGMMVLAIICAVLVQAVVIRATAAYARGEKASLGASVAGGLSKILPLIALAILSALAIMVGWLLLVVPGIILLLMWCVAAPALVVEDLGVFEAFSRSRALTKGYRWKIFGIGLLLLVIAYLILAVVGIGMVMGGGGAAMIAAQANGGVPILLTLLSLFSNTVIGALSATVPASIYLALRSTKEGPQIDQLADMFA